MFALLPLERRLEDTAYQQVDLSEDSLHSSSDDARSHDIYIERLEELDRDGIFARADALASVDVALLSADGDFDFTLACHPKSKMETRKSGYLYENTVDSDEVETASGESKSPLDLQHDANHVGDSQWQRAGGTPSFAAARESTDVATEYSYFSDNESIKHNEDDLARVNVQENSQLRTSSDSFWSTWWS